MPVNAVKLFKVLVQVADTVHDIGQYAGPVVDEIMKRRAKAPTRPDGQDETVEETRAKIAAAIETAREGQAAAQAELDALDRKAGG